MLGRTQDFAALIGRIGIAVVFLVHGLQKLDAGIGTTADLMGQAGIPLPTLAAIFTIAVEVLGSIAFLVGLALPLVAIGYAVISIGAVFFVHMDAGFFLPNGYEYVLVLAVASLAVGFNGGRFSLDHVLLSRRRSAREPELVSAPA